MFVILTWTGRITIPTRMNSHTQLHVQHVCPLHESRSCITLKPVGHYAAMTTCKVPLGLHTVTLLPACWSWKYLLFLAAAKWLVLYCSSHTAIWLKFQFLHVLYTDLKSTHAPLGWSWLIMFCCNAESVANYCRSNNAIHPKPSFTVISSHGSKVCLCVLAGTCLCVSYLRWTVLQHWFSIPVRLESSAGPQSSRQTLNHKDTNTCLRFMTLSTTYPGETFNLNALKIDN